MMAGQGTNKMWEICRSHSIQIIFKDIPNANKGKHIVFNSDDEDDETPAPQKKTLFEEATDSDEGDGSGAVERQHLKEKVEEQRQ